MFNSKYDAWQLGSEFQSDWSTKAEQAGVLQYGKGRDRQGVQGAHLNTLGLFLNPLGPFLRTSVPFVWRILGASLPA
jgi:hypothetical protein